MSGPESSNRETPSRFSDHYGDIKPGGLGEEGLYHEGTRFLSLFLLEMEGCRPLFLGSAVRDENDQLAVALTNPDLLRDGQVWLPLGTVHLALKKFLWRGVYYQQLRVKNYSLEAVETTVFLHFEADFADIYEVRGAKRPARGEILKAVVSADGVTLGYRGLDGVVRRMVLRIDPCPSSLTAAAAQFGSLAAAAAGNGLLGVDRLRARSEHVSDGTLRGGALGDPERSRTL